MRRNKMAIKTLNGPAVAWVAALFLVLTTLAGCSSPSQRADSTTEAEAPKSSVRLSYTGCGITKKAFMAELAAAFQTKTGVEIDISGGGATKGIVNASGGTAELGGGCRHRISGPEEANARQVHVAWDALVAIANPGNPVSELTADQLRSILTGETQTWSAVGGDQAVRIAVGARSGKVSGVGRMVRELVFGDVSTDYASSALTYPSSGPLEQAIEKSRTMIGMTGVSSAKKRDVKILAIDGVEPTYENIASGRYPYARPLFIYLGATPSAEAQAFVDFARSPEGQAVIRAQGTVNLADGAGLAEPYRQAMQSLEQPSELWEL